MKRHVLTGFLAVALLWASSAAAILIDPYDNIRAPDGVYGLLYGNYYTADEFTDSDGNEAAELDFTATVGLARAIAYFHWGPAPLAFQVIVPFGKLEESESNIDSSGLGDVIFGPGIFLYQNQESGTYLSYWLYFISPTGEWNEENGGVRGVNLGQNHWYFQHQLAYNQSMGKFVFDMNLNFYHHTEETDTNTTRASKFEVEASLAYHITQKFLLGLNGGGYWDLDDDSVEGAEDPESKAVRLQFGPSLAYQLTDRVGLNARWTHDFESENDTKGDDFWLRVSYAF